MRITSISIFVLFLLFAPSCQKKIFRRIRVKGRILNSATLKPIETKVFLVGDDAWSSSSYAEHAHNLASTMSNIDGTFTLSSRQSTREHYFIYAHDSLGRKISVDFKSGSSEFFCKSCGTREIGDVYLNW